MARKRLPDEDRTKLQPKLRMIANGSDDVNVIRAERCAAVAVESARLLKRVKPQRDEEAVPRARGRLPGSVRRGRLKRPSHGVRAGVFIQTSGAAQGPPVPGAIPRGQDLFTASVRISQLPGIAKRPDVRYVEMAEQLSVPRVVVAGARAEPPVASPRRFGRPGSHRGGKGVVIGIVDVEGFDFAHPDFLGRAGRSTRFAAIWDQGGSIRPHPESEDGRFDYGSELRKEHLERALRAGPRVGVLLRLAPDRGRGGLAPSLRGRAADLDQRVARDQRARA